jgi:hypothetical protein
MSIAVHESMTLDLANRVAGRFGIGLHQAGITSVTAVGSLRRQKATINDLEFIAPMPADGQPDRLHRVLTSRFYNIDQFGIRVPDADTAPRRRPKAEAMLFGASAPAVATPELDDEPAATLERWGAPLKGLRPGFKACSLLLHLKHPQQIVKLEVYRYDEPGPIGMSGHRTPPGNRGWIEMIRTGPADFGPFMLWRWKKASCGGCSDLGYPCLPSGAAVPCITEADAFELCRVPWIEPQARDNWQRRLSSELVGYGGTPTWAREVAR